MNIVCKYFIFMAIITSTECYRILGIFHFPVRSHFILGSALMKGLAEKGHDVTIVSSFPDKNLPKNLKYREIILTGHTNMKEYNRSCHWYTGNLNKIKTALFINQLNNVIVEKTLSHPNFQELLQSPKETFDVVIIEEFKNDALKAISHYYKAHLILFSSMPVNYYINSGLGQPSNPSYIPELLLNLPPKMSFSQRLYNTCMKVFNKMNSELIFFPEQNRIMKKYFPDSPDLDVLNYNVSLLLLNSHVSVSHPSPYTRNMIDIGGFHLKTPKQLPTNLKEFLDSSDRGVIYFSMGSNLQSREMPPYVIKLFTDTFSKVKQNIIWKFEGVLPNKSRNIRTEKWLNQQDILGHPNIKLFISHCGLLSVMESVYHGIPMLTIPIYGDQKSNAATVEFGGYGLTLDYYNLTELELYNKINEIINNPKYVENAKRRSKIFKDIQNTPMDTANYWIEYVVKHRGAVHLRSNSLHLTWYQYLILDVLLVLGIFLLLIAIIAYMLFKKTTNLFKMYQKYKTKTQ